MEVTPAFRAGEMGCSGLAAPSLGSPGSLVGGGSNVATVQCSGWDAAELQEAECGQAATGHRDMKAELSSEAL